MSVQVFPNLEALSIATAELFVAKGALHPLLGEMKGVVGHEPRATSHKPPTFKVALAGGNTPKRLYELLAAPPYRDQVDWAKVLVFWGDERWVPPSDPQSNEGMARAALLNHVPIPPEQVFPMYRPSSADDGAKAYEAILREHGPMDLVLLGMGDDGHTASLFPGIPELAITERLVVPTLSPKGVPQRLTMTIPALCEASLVLFLVAGADKRESLRRALGDDDSVRPPSGIVANKARAALWFVDEAAGGVSACSGDGQ